MSRHVVYQPVTGAEVAYGYDHVVGYFFQVFAQGEFVMGKDSMFDGLSHAQFLTELERLAVLHLMPAEHRQAIVLDLPF